MRHDRRLFGWDLPPGVTQSMIDAHYGFVCPVCEDEECEGCEEEQEYDSTEEKLLAEMDDDLGEMEE